ncbi:hypothetical protein PQR71_24840 [Paraburkholderia fungorum]|jgi:hypothetical protein|uniref:hypothetical protein n=1 Tax=Paraburkholderia fungorum TaxID=134537 RepID=UPI0038B8E2BA
MSVSGNCYFHSQKAPPRADLLASAEDITYLMGYPFIDKLETEFLLPEEMERKYGAEKSGYVVPAKSS